MEDTILRTKGLRKQFTVKKQTVHAVNGVDLHVQKGDIFGFLGPNGAGKTTTLRMLTTLLPIDEGEAFVAGIDVQKMPGEVRKHIGYVSQEGGADPEATGWEDLVLQARLYGMSHADAKARAKEVIGKLQLEQFANRKVKTYSGGQRRRLNVAAGIMHRPDILFLDEPSTGLDPQNRANLWEQIRTLRDDGTTVFLTTHYLDEADSLSDQLAIMDNGKIVASGTPHELKAKTAGEAIILKPTSMNKLDMIQKYLSEQPFTKEVRIEGNDVRVYVADGAKVLPKVMEVLNAKGIELGTLSLVKPSLDDVFLMQTGRSLRDAHQEGNKT